MMAAGLRTTVNSVEQPLEPKGGTPVLDHGVLVARNGWLLRAWSVSREPAGSWHS
jgi:hypothetical protein